MTNVRLMHEVWHLKLLLWDIIERYVRDGGGGGGSGCGGHMYTYGQFIFMYRNNHHNIVIIL